MIFTVHYQLVKYFCIIIILVLLIISWLIRDYWALDRPCLELHKKAFVCICKNIYDHSRGRIRSKKNFFLGGNTIPPANSEPCKNKLFQGIFPVAPPPPSCAYGSQRTAYDNNTVIYINILDSFNQVKTGTNKTLAYPRKKKKMK